MATVSVGMRVVMVLDEDEAQRLAGLSAAQVLPNELVPVLTALRKLGEPV